MDSGIFLSVSERSRRSPMATTSLSVASRERREHDEHNESVAADCGSIMRDEAILWSPVYCSINMQLTRTDTVRERVGGPDLQKLLQDDCIE
jgi:hypothetical protein